MNLNLAYFIDSLEMRLKSAKAARDWDEASNLYHKLQELYSMQNKGIVPAASAV